MSPSLQISDTLLATAFEAARKSVSAFARRQHADGYWWGDLTGGDATLEADYLLLQLWLHSPAGDTWQPPDLGRAQRAVNSILTHQASDGGFSAYPKGPADVSASVKAYCALKLATRIPGITVDLASLDRCRETILALGGMQAANSYVKINLSLFGLYPREFAPSIPPELMLSGPMIYEMSSWTRAIVIPLSVLHAANPQKPVPTGFNLDELLKPGVPLEFKTGANFFSWKNLFFLCDDIVKFWDRYQIDAVRRRAINMARDWVLQRFEKSDGLAAIYPPMMYAIMMLDLLGYAPDHPARAEAQRQFDRLLVDDGDRFFHQPCFSVVWDTAIAAFALGESGLADPAMLRRCGDWLLSKEVRTKGDWSVKRPNLEPSGWYFEFANEHYPDIDDTAMVLKALHHTGASNSAELRAVRDRAVAWTLGMQSKDGGWAAFDVDNNWEFLADVPFADHNAMLDPTCPDITGRVLEGLILSGVDPQHPAIRKGVDYLIRTQEPDGSWFGRWGVNYVYGTFLALRGLRAAGESDREAHVLRAGEWLRSIQNADGGWGESCESYRKGSFVPAPSTASQTAWAVMGLLAGGDDTSQSVHHGVEHLVDTQREDGTWYEELATGTGFPNVYYLTYHLYRDSFPLMALSEWLKVKRSA
ncbi:MAG: squalene--hopene cyclase [Bryobacteraceae bacterium]|nr:squalene--hopene cyclase [Bryobacteraceae bacterium]